MVESTAIELVSKDVPAHVTKGTGLGNEEVGQANSNNVKRSGPKSQRIH